MPFSVECNIFGEHTGDRAIIWVLFAITVILLEASIYVWHVDSIANSPPPKVYPIKNALNASKIHDFYYQNTTQKIPANCGYFTFREA